MLNPAPYDLAMPGALGLVQPNGPMAFNVIQTVFSEAKLTSTHKMMSVLAAQVRSPGAGVSWAMQRQNLLCKLPCAAVTFQLLHCVQVMRTRPPPHLERRQPPAAVLCGVVAVWMTGPVAHLPHQCTRLAV